MKDELIEFVLLLWKFVYLLMGNMYDVDDLF